jgi:hypothetical protein
MPVWSAGSQKEEKPQRGGCDSRSHVGCYHFWGSGDRLVQLRGFQTETLPNFRIRGTIKLSDMMMLVAWVGVVFVLGFAAGWFAGRRSSRRSRRKHSN